MYLNTSLSLSLSLSWKRVFTLRYELSIQIICTWHSRSNDLLNQVFRRIPSPKRKFVRKIQVALLASNFPKNSFKTLAKTQPALLPPSLPNVIKLPNIHPNNPHPIMLPSSITNILHYFQTAWSEGLAATAWEPSSSKRLYLPCPLIITVITENVCLSLHPAVPSLQVSLPPAKFGQDRRT